MNKTNYREKRNEYTVVGEITKLRIISKRHGEFTAIIDTEDMPRVKAFIWFVSMVRGKTPYFMGTIGSKSNGYGSSILLSRLIKSFPDAMVDHISGNTLDNRNKNLRIASATQNAHNRSPHGKSGLKGVYRTRCKTNKFAARINVGGKDLHLGVFETDTEAALAHDIAAAELRGEFARLNYKDRGSY